MPELEPITREEMFLDGQDLEPITREEMFIKRIYDKTQVVPEPITRHEMFLKKAGEGGSDIDVVQLTVTENGTYSEQGKAYSPVIVDVSAPLPENAYLIKDAEAPADIVTFNDGQALPMPSLQIGINAVQSGSGDPSPSNVRPISGFTEGNVSVSGKNLFGLNESPQNNTYLNNNGVETSTIGWILSDWIMVNPNTTFIFNPNTTEGDSAKHGFYDVNKNFISAINSGLRTFTTPSNCYFMRFSYRNTSDNIQLEIGSTATTYEPYNGHTTTISWEDEVGTVYGGALDVVSGELTVTDGYIASYNGETLPSTWISDRDVYAEGTTPTTGAEVVYELATPTTYQLSPTAVASLLGENNVWADCGQILEGSYFSKEA